MHAFCTYDDKLYLIENGVDTVAHGHRELRGAC